MTRWTVACQVLLSVEFSRQEYWSRLPFPPPGDLPDPGIKPTSLVSPALAGGFFATVPLRKPRLGVRESNTGILIECWWSYQVFCLKIPTCDAETFSMEDITNDSWTISEAMSSPGAKTPALEYLLVVFQSLSCVRLSATHMNCSTPGFPVLHCLQEFDQTHVR